MDKIVYLINNFKNIRKTDLLALILMTIMNDNNLTKNDYAVISGYGLREIKEVTDLDVACSKKAFKILSNCKYIKSGVSKINKNNRLFIVLKDISDDAEIEFFEAENNGFPDNNYSLRNLQKGNNIIYDFIGNPYINILTTVSLYSSAKLVNNKIVIGYDTVISKERLIKNINQLEKLLAKYPEHKLLISNKIVEQKNILSKI